jgi:hypothetical protein
MLADRSRHVVANTKVLALTGKLTWQRGAIAYARPFASLS